jgi:hypothetical protein
MATKLTGRLPPGRGFESRFSANQMRQFIYSAKLRTQDRLIDIRKHSFFFSAFGCRDEGNNPIYVIRNAKRSV